MKLLRLSLWAGFVAMLAASARADIWLDGVFLETQFLNATGLNLDGAAAVSIPAGGNMAEYPDPAGLIPKATFASGGQSITIQLQNSTIGYPMAATPGVLDAMLTEGRRLLRDAVRYVDAPLTDETVDHERAEGQAWTIKFPGVINPQTGDSYPDASFYPEKLHEAAGYYRAALRADPFNETAAHGLLRTYYERMAANTFAGHNGNERAAYVRLQLGNIYDEIAVLEGNALAFYTNATQELTLLTARPLEAQLFDGSYPYVAMQTLAPNRNRLLEAYTRAITHQAETVFHLGRLKQFNGYSNPLLDGGAFPGITALVNDLVGQRASLAERQLLLLLAPALTDVAEAEQGRARYLIGRIQSLESSIADGRIAFIAAHNEGTPDQPNISYNFREYSPNFVPFHALVGNKLSHEQFLENANSFLTRASIREAAAKAVTREFDTQQFALTNALNSLKGRYYDELGTLCGRIRNQNGQLVPDVMLALYPDSQRKLIHSYTGPGESRGEFGAQWGRIEAAHTDVSAAEQELQAIYSQMAKKSEVAGEIANGLTNLAQLYLENGEKLEGLDHQAGNLQAQAAIDRAEALKRNEWSTGLMTTLTTVAAAAVAVYTGGASSAIFASSGFWASAAGGGLFAGLGAYGANEAAAKTGNIEADLARNLATIQAQRTRIATLERVAVQFQQRDQFLLQTEEALHALLLQAERQKLAILLARQRLGGEFLALQNLGGRVQYLLQEYASALALEHINPLRSPDYRLVRDIEMREAEDAFHLAHRWVYLAAKSVEYRMNSSSSAEASLLQNLVGVTLRARNASTLQSAITALNDQLEIFYVGQNRETSGIEPDYLSIRHHLVQRNQLQAGDDREIAAAEVQPEGQTTIEHWQRFLREHLATAGNGTPQRLLIPLATSLDRWPPSVDPRFRNPLYQSASHNEIISSVSSFGQFHRGIELQIVGRALSLGGAPAVFRLQYLGVSGMRQEQCAEIGGRRLQYWEIRRPDGAPYTAEGALGINTWQNSGTPGFDEFSPANDRWSLEIIGSRSSGNAILLNNLDKIEDIRIRFWTRYFPSSFECN